LKRKYFLYIAIFLTIAITVGSLISMKNVVKAPIHFFDKILHSSAYFMLALSWLLAFKNKKSIKFATAIAFAVFIYGIIIEVLQGTLTNYRQADLYDMLANLVGITCALLVFVTFSQKNQ
jgi:VanZ family protein